MVIGYFFGMSASFVSERYPAAVSTGKACDINYKVM